MMISSKHKLKEEEGWEMEEGWAGWGSTIASLMFLVAIISQYFPNHLEGYFSKFMNKVTKIFYPYIQIKIDEFPRNSFKRSVAYQRIEAYLTEHSSRMAKNMNAEMIKDNNNLTLSMGDYEEIVIEFQNVKLWWSSNKTSSRTPAFPPYVQQEDKRHYTLTFHKKHRNLVVGSYLKYVMEEGKNAQVKNRQRKLYTNSPNTSMYGHTKSAWTHVLFEHPATFDTLAIDPEKKKEIIEDLDTFKESKDYYKRIGKAWKRGYLLYGPPGTGKSTMIAAMANYLDYDVYDLELTAVKDNTQLRKLLIETTSKSIMVIEDIDCSLDLSGRRKKKKNERLSEEYDKMNIPYEIKNESSKVTLSGLLNFIDGLWSSCGGERLVIFTTNHLDKLDPALIRRGRMDKHIELSYCDFESFKVLSKNYLGVDCHHKFERINELLMDAKVTPADVAENLMLKTLVRSKESVIESCLNNFIEVLEKTKEENSEKIKEENSEKIKEETKELSPGMGEEEEEKIQVKRKVRKVSVKLAKCNRDSG